MAHACTTSPYALFMNVAEQMRSPTLRVLAVYASYVAAVLLAEFTTVCLLVSIILPSERLRSAHTAVSPLLWIAGQSQVPAVLVVFHATRDVVFVVRPSARDRAMVAASAVEYCTGPAREEGGLGLAALCSGKSIFLARLCVGPHSFRLI
jgi:hypothetical protein